MRYRNVRTLSILALLLITGTASTIAAPEERDSYIIKFIDSVNLDNEIDSLKMGGGQVKSELRGIFKGAVVTLNQGQASALARKPQVEIIEKDSMARIQLVRSPTSLWGLDRIDQTSKTVDGNYSYTTTGQGVNVYVVDTGIESSLTEFQGRASQLKNFTTDTDNSDCNGHGTHVAGTIGSQTYGVAKQATLLGYKVLNCAGEGMYSWIISALNDIAISGKKPAVVNMSLGGPKSFALNSAVASLTKAGFVVVVAAGNEGTIACNASPASAPTAITVGASTPNDARASFSNYGKCLDIFAPGVGIQSVSISIDLAGNKTTITPFWDGTSMASPHVAGIAARYLSGNTTASVTSVTNEIINTAINGALTSVGTQSPNRLLFRNENK